MRCEVDGEVVDEVVATGGVLNLERGMTVPWSKAQRNQPTHNSSSLPAAAASQATHSTALNRAAAKGRSIMEASSSSRQSTGSGRCWCEVVWDIRGQGVSVE